MKKISLYKFGFFLIFSAILSLGISSEAKANYAFYNGDNGLFNFDSGLGISGNTYAADYYGNVFRAYGSNPFYFQDYGGGWYMNDTSWVRTWGEKNVWTGGGLLGTNGGLTVGYNGTTPPSGGAIIAGNVGIGTNNPGAKLDVAGGMRGTSMTISTLGAGVIMADSSGTFYTTPLSTINSGIITGAAQWNPDGDGPDLIYDDGNPTYNGKAFGAIINMNGDGSQDGALVRSGAFEGNYFQAANGFFIGSPDSNGTQIINSSGGAYFPGSVGIGTINPEAKLDVDGNITQSVTHGNNLKLWLSAARNGGSTGEVGLYSWISEPGATWTGGGIARNMSNSSSSFPRINTGLSGQMMHFTEAGNIEFVVENASGTRYTPLFVGLNSNVGIGSTVPVASLDVASKLRFTSGGTIYNADSSRWLDLSGALGDSLRVSGAIRMGSGLYNSNGNQVIEGNTSDWLRIAAGGGYTNGTAAYGNWAFGQGGVSIGSWIGNISSGNLYVSNNVGIGITNPTQKLEVNGNAVFDGIIGVGTTPSAGYAIDADGTIRASYFEGTATRANSLTANGSNCLAGQYPVGIDASGNAEGCTTAATTVDAVNYVNSPDGDRNPNNKLPTTSPQRVRFDFSNASYTGTGGNYAGVMTYAPWFGTTGSTGDASYQLAFGSTATNGSGIPQLRIRNGIDSTWNGWKTIITDNGNGNVGIGTTAPLYKLQVNGTIYANNAAGGVLVNSGGSSRGIYSDTYNYYSPNSYSNHAWLRNSNNTWTFQGGTAGEDWTQTAQIYLNSVGTAGANDKLIEIGQRASNAAAGDYKGVRITQYTDSAITDGYLQAGSSYFSGNVGIGITSPSQKLEVNGNAVFDGLIGIGTAPSTGYAIDADGKIRASSFEGNLSGTATSLAANGTNCAAGSYPLGVDASGNAEGCTVAATGGLSGSGAANYVARWTGTTALSIGALYDNGTNVSIGTTAPGAKLDVQGKIRISNNGDNVYSSYSGGLNYELIGTYAGWNASTVYLAGYNASNGGSATAIAFGGSGKERLYTNLTTGNVGIGTITPSTKLYVSGGDIYSSNSIMAGGDIYSNGSYYYGKDNNVVMEYDDGWLRLNPNGDFYSGIYAAGSIVRTDGELQVGGDGSTFRVINGGNVGIGTTAPRTKLEVNGTINTTNAGGNTTGELNVGPNGLYSWNGSTRYIRFNTSGTVNDLKSAGADLVINYDSGKNVQIGPGYNKPSKLSVVGNLAVGDATFVNTAAPTSGLSVQGNTGIGTASPTSKLEVVGDAKATSFTYSSDRNLKTNIKTVNNALSKIQKLRGVTFNWKKDGSKSVGLIAQEVEQVFPELVSGTEGNKGVEYGNLVGPLIEAIKEQQKEIDKLQYRISVLEKTSVKKTK